MACPSQTNQWEMLLLAPLVRKGSNFDPVLCGLSPPVLEDRVAGVHLYLLSTRNTRQSDKHVIGHRRPVAD
jgi:hypothetical protein